MGDDGDQEYIAGDAAGDGQRRYSHDASGEEDGEQDSPESLHLTLESESVEDDGRAAHAGGGPQGAAQAAHNER